jgi:acetylglutamate kinase
VLVGGSQISAALHDADIPNVFSKAGRVTNAEGRAISVGCLRKNQKSLTDILTAEEIQAEVVIPVFLMGSRCVSFSGIPKF